MLGTKIQFLARLIMELATARRQLGKFLVKSELKKKLRIKARKNTIVEHLDYQIPVTQLKGPKGNGDMPVVKRD